MRIKKNIIVLMLVSLCLSGCGKDVEQQIEIKHNDADYDYKDEIEVWTQSEDLKQFAQKYEEQTGIKVNVTRTDLADYEDKINDYFRNYNNDQNFMVRMYL